MASTYTLVFSLKQSVFYAYLWLSVYARVQSTCPLLVDGWLVGGFVSDVDGSDAGDVHTISELIRSQMAVTGRSFRELEKASGHRVKYQTFQGLASAHPKSWPKNVETIRGIAQALDVDEMSVVIGFAKSLGVNVSGASALVQQLPAGTESIPVRTRNALVSLIQAISIDSATVD